MMGSPITSLLFLCTESRFYLHLFCCVCMCAVAAFVSGEKYCFDGLREGISSELHNRAPHPPPLSNKPALSLSLC